MYSLLVANNSEEWNGDPFILETEHCIKVSEYTDRKIVDKYGDLSLEQIEEIIQFPCIFAYETQCHKNPQFGYIHEIVKRQKKVKIQYEIIRLDKFLTQSELEEMHFELDIHSWEYNRTHWAITDVNLPIELIAKGVYLPQLKSLNKKSTREQNDNVLFEKLIAELLTSMGFTEITESKGVDRGFDFLATYPIKSPAEKVALQQWAIEAKYYSDDRIGRDTLYQLLTNMKENNADKALLVTNTSLSSFAKELVTRINLGTEQQLEVWDGPKLATLLAQYPDIQRKYSALTLQTLPISSASAEPEQIDIIERLKQCQPGKQDCYKFEDICIEILTKVFVPPLKSPKIQARTLSGLERRDALFSIRGVKQGWDEIRQEFDASFLLCEFKNYVDAFDKDEVNQTRNYLKDTIGRLGIIFSRKGASPSAMTMRNSIYSQERKVILFFEDKHLIELLRMKEVGQNPLDLIQDAIEDFLISYE